MYDVYLCLTTQHDWRLVIVAVAVCAVACASTFFLYGNLPAEKGGRRLAWLTMVGLVAGSGVWTTHFVAMLAFRTGFPERYDAPGTALSLVAVVAAAMLGFAIASRAGPGRDAIWPRLSGGLVVGLGVAVMHYMGMAAYRTTGDLTWRSGRVVESIVIGAILAPLALATAWPGCSRLRRIAAAVLFMLGIAGLHFTAMAAVSILPDPGRLLPRALMSNDTMAGAAVAMTGLIIIGAGAGAIVDFFSHRRELQRLRDALDAMPDGLAFFDGEDRLQAWNSRYADLRLGLPLYRGQSYREIVSQGLEGGRFLGEGVDKDAWLDERVRVRREGGWVDMMTAGGRWLRCHDRRAADGGIVTVFTDITDLKRAEETMAQAHDLAQEASLIKSQFLANMSHEIRTPMNGILGMNALLMMTSLTPAQKRYAEVVQSSADNLMAIFNDIIDVARLEAGAVEMASVTFDLRDLLREAEAEHRPAARAKGLELALALDDREGSWMLGDPARLRQVVAHLLSNAVKFTDAGEVTLAMRSRALNAGRTWFRIEVSDTGSGVAPDLKQALFEPFRQADGGATRRHGGAGLGLAICRHAVRLMGGAIGVLDRDGGGSVFWVELTLPNAAKDESVAAA